jgi:hypothetical protein
MNWPWGTGLGEYQPVMTALKRYNLAHLVGRCRLTVSKHVLKAPGSKRLKLGYDVPLSNFAFNFNLSRYNLVKLFRENKMDVVAFRGITEPMLEAMVVRCKLKPAES